MNRRRVLIALAASALAGLVPSPARAAGLIRFKNRSFPGGVTVDVRVGDTLESAPLYGTQRIPRGDDWEVDTSGALAWWRREVNPGKNDGRYTDWTLVDSSRSDEHVDL